ncbi:MAG: KOW domain-containing RNA-binding protein [Clostridia bacterium]|nr:KOW domain-containing RNA-binding protein [Clostridia bacterium]
MKTPELGMLVTARAGRDKGRRFLIVGRFDEAHALIADGDTRRLARPKKKKLMHLNVEPRCAEAIRGRLERGETVQDAEIRKAIVSLTREQRQD